MHALVPFLRAIGRFKSWLCAGQVRIGSDLDSSSSTNGTLRSVTRIGIEREEGLPEAFREPSP